MGSTTNHLLCEDQVWSFQKSGVCALDLNRDLRRSQHDYVKKLIVIEYGRGSWWLLSTVKNVKNVTISRWMDNDTYDSHPSITVSKLPPLARTLK